MLLNQLLLLVTAVLSPSVAKVFYVTPVLPATESCPPPCHTLDQYVQNVSLLTGNTNITLVFLAGTHNLSYGWNFSGNGQNVIVQGRTNAMLSVSTFIVTDLASFEMFDIDLIGGIDTGSGNNIMSLKNISDVGFSAVHISKINAMLENVSQTIIKECNLKNGGIQVFSVRDLSIENCVLNNTNVQVAASNMTDLYIKNSMFTNSLMFLMSIQFLKIENCKFNGGNIGLYLKNTWRVLIQNSFISNYRLFGMIFVITNEVVISEGSHISHNYIGVASVNSGLTVNDTVLTGNDFGVAALVFDSLGEIPEQYQIIKMSNSSFNENNGALVLLNLLQNKVTIEDCRFEYNTGTPISAYQSKFELRGETVFRENTASRGGGLGLYSNSTVVFGSDSHTMFINNTAIEFGGAIYIGRIISFPREILIAADRINEISKSVQGIKLSLDQLVNADNILEQKCFYQLLSNSHQITFNGNTALYGGFDIFGPALYNEKCSVTKNQAFEFTTSDLSYQIVSNPTRVCFCIDDVPQCRDRSQFVREETRYPGESFTVSVALAGYNFGRVAGSVYTNILGRDYNDVIGGSRHVRTTALKNCSELEYTISSDLSAVLVLTAQDLPTEQGNENDVEVSRQNLQLSRCDNATSPCTTLRYTPIYINVTLEDCPLGFMLNDINICDCDHTINNINKYISASSITCELYNHTGYINREGTVWVGVDTSQNNTDVYYWHQYCPLDYCNSLRTPVDLRSPDSQCNSNRAGILCGRCAAGHTLQLGGNKCIPLSSCSNNYLSLIVVFIALGILLVAFIKVLDLTVARGTINGLILYANIAWRYNTILFPQEKIGYYIITVPIAWINLDFGIETCFSEHLDQVTKTGLQFVFPLYIWCIAGLIIFVSHYSKRATKLFGNNSVGVLATLFLLSYGKISRNIIDVFTIANIMDSNNTQRKVWALDGTVEFDRTAGHIVLILIALVFLFIFWLPFTLSLLLVPFLRAKSHVRPFHWINTLKPFFDTFYGPYKDKKQHQVWISILLISRMVILIVYATTSTLNPNANILLMTLIANILLVYTAMVSLHYKKWYVSALEVLYILNLMVLGVAFLFHQTLTPAPEYPLSPIAATSVLIALAQFTCILVYHAIRQINVIKQILKKETRDMGVETNEAKPDASMGKHNAMHQLIEVKENFAPFVTDDYDPTVFREPLLEDISYKRLID